MNILLPNWLGAPERWFYQDFQAGIAEALRDFGHQPFGFGFRERAPLHFAAAKQLYREITAARIDTVLDLACWGFGLSRVMLPPINGASQPLYDGLGITYLAWLFDHPFNQQLEGVLARKKYALYPDLGHAQQVRLIYPELRPSGELFAPPAVRPKNDFSVPDWTGSRPVDVLYLGNLEVQALAREWRGLPKAHWPPSFDPGFCEALADAMLLAPDRSLHLCLQEVMNAHGKTPPAFNVRFHVSVVENFLRHLYRRNAVLALAGAGIRMQVVGKGWEMVGLPANVSVQAHTDYEGMFRLAARAKICLDVSTYLDGANDRVFSYALNRSVCFTNASGYLGGAMGEQGGVHFYRMGDLDGLRVNVQTLLAKPRLLQELGERAAQIVRSTHTWHQRMGDVLSSLARQPVGPAASVTTHSVNSLTGPQSR